MSAPNWSDICGYYGGEGFCGLEIDHMVLRIALEETEELCDAFREENEYLSERIRLYEDILSAHNIELPAE